jgi:hypothetical protein
LTSEQRTKVRETIFAGNNVPRRDNANFSARVGTVVPNDVRIVAVPETLVEIHPEWRDYDYFVVRDDVVIVDHSHRIVGVVSTEQSGQRAPAGSSAGLSQRMVREVQMKLNQKGFDVGTPDGVMGPQTKEALLQFQRQQGLAASGEIDNETMAALDIGPSTTGQGRP